MIGGSDGRRGVGVASAGIRRTVEAPETSAGATNPVAGRVERGIAALDVSAIMDLASPRGADHDANFMIGVPGRGDRRSQAA